MARKPPSYAAVELEPVKAADAEVTFKPGRPRAAQTLKEASKPVMLYLHPAAVRALKQYALNENTKVHTLLLEAVQEWFASHGLREPVRVAPVAKE